MAGWKPILRRATPHSPSSCVATAVPGIKRKKCIHETVPSRANDHAASADSCSTSRPSACSRFVTSYVPDDCVPGRPADAPLVPPKLRASLSPVLSAWVDRRKDERWALCAADTAAALAPGANATSAWLHAHQLYTPSDTHLLQLQHETDPDGGVGDAAWIASRVDCEGCLKPTDLAAGADKRWERPNWVDHGFAVKSG